MPGRRVSIAWLPRSSANERRPSGQSRRAGGPFDKALTQTTGEDAMAYPSSLNSATLIGRVTRDPELRTTSTSAGERSVLSLGIAVRKSSRPDNDHTPAADFFDATVWGEARRDVLTPPLQGAPGSDLCPARTDRVGGEGRLKTSRPGSCRQHGSLPGQPTQHRLPRAAARGAPRRCVENRARACLA